MQFVRERVEKMRIDMSPDLMSFQIFLHSSLSLYPSFGCRADMIGIEVVRGGGRHCQFDCSDLDSM